MTNIRPPDTTNAINDLLPLLNAIMDDDRQWVVRRSKKPYMDDFGVQIPAYKDYYFRRSADAFDEVCRLSVDSMSRFLTSLFRGNPHLRDHASQQIQRRLELKLAVVAKHRP
jgi:hypothetical protein